MLPVDPGLLEAGIQQPLVFINSWDFQWRENVLAMMKLVTDSDDGKNWHFVQTRILSGVSILKC